MEEAEFRKEEGWGKFRKRGILMKPSKNKGTLFVFHGEGKPDRGVKRGTIPERGRHSGDLIKNCRRKRC